MSIPDQMKISYDYITRDAPQVHNSNFDKSLRDVEQLVMCRCFGKYIVHVNGENPISDTVMDGVFCPHCGLPAKDFLTISGHSADVFNATLSRAY